MSDLLPELLGSIRDSEGSLTQRLTDRLRALIVEGYLPAGHKIPSSRALALKLGVSRNTVVIAVDQLVAEGYLTVSQSRRPIVATSASLASGNRRDRARPIQARKSSVSQWARGLTLSTWSTEANRPRAFRPGLADERSFPHEVWGRCFRHAVRRPSTSYLAANDPALCEVLQAYLASNRGIHARAGQILILPSAQAALSLIAKVMIEAGDAAWIESPGYVGAYAALRAAGAKVVGVPIDAHGLRFDVRSNAPRIIFVTPSHQYPTGVLMPVGRRQELLRYASRIGAAIIEDDYDGDFHYEGRPVPALSGLDPEALVFYVGTFSKAMSAGVRVGYVVVPNALLDAFAMAQRHLGLMVPSSIQSALEEFIGRGAYLAHIRRMTRLYRDRRDFLIEALTSAGRAGLKIQAPPGGMQLLARCDPSIDDVALARRMEASGVSVRPLSEMLYHASRERGLFLGFAAWDRTEIAAGAEIIGRLFPQGA